MGLLSFKYRLEALVKCDFMLEVLPLNSLLAPNPKELKKSNFSRKGQNCKNLRYEGLIIIDSKYIEISSLAVLNMI